MKTVVDPYEVKPIETSMLVENEVLSNITMTLFDLIAALQSVLEPDEDVLIVATVVHLLRSGRIT